MTPYPPSLACGLLLGLSAVLLLIVNGQIAAISGIVGRVLGGEQIAPNIAFVVGLLAGPILYAAAYGLPFSAQGFATSVVGGNRNGAS